VKVSHQLIIVNLREQRDVEEHCVKGGSSSNPKRLNIGEYQLLQN
jgi:hypothetical protein